MHPDTFKHLTAAADHLRRHIDERTPAQAFETAHKLAQAERLLAAHEATAKPLPSRWATVHVMGHERFTGEVEFIPGGYRVRWLDSDTPSDSDEEPIPRIRDVYALHSVEWLAEAEHERHVANLLASMKRRAREEHRRLHWPEGYEHAVATHPSRVNDGSRSRHAFIHRATPLVAGFYEAKSEAQEAAWRHVDNDLSDNEHLDLTDPENAVASTEEAFAVVSKAEGQDIPF